MNIQYDQMAWMADEDAIKIDALGRMRMVDYFALLNKKIGRIRKEQNKWQKKI